jgi:hypothetical protein
VYNFCNNPSGLCSYTGVVFYLTTHITPNSDSSRNARQLAAIPPFLSSTVNSYDVRVTHDFIFTVNICTVTYIRRCDVMNIPCILLHCIVILFKDTSVIPTALTRGVCCNVTDCKERWCDESTVGQKFSLGYCKMVRHPLGEGRQIKTLEGKMWMRVTQAANSYECAYIGINK